MMSRQASSLAIFIAASISSLAANAESQQYPAILAGHAVLPANTFITPPNDVPPDLMMSGKFISATRQDKAHTIEGLSAGRPTGISYPFEGQPIQGHSGIKKMADGSYWILTDNGAGNKVNSPDFMLYLNQYQIDFTNNTVNRLRTIFLHDPDKNVPFRIANEATDTRYLTGADFDPESFQFAGGFLWVGDEFGPYLIKADLNGKVLQIFETKVEDNIVHSPDHYQVKTPGQPTDKVNFEVKRSKGFEGMAVSADGTKLYPLLEGPLFDAKTQQYEHVDGKNYLRILEFDITKNTWTGRSWQYPLAENHHAIGDFNMIDSHYGLIIERDNGEGVIEYACQGDQSTTHCFDKNNLPKFKRVYKVKMDESNVNQAVDKVAYIDLLAIDDPNHLSKAAYSQGKFVFPFFTIENVDIVDNQHIIVGNDNNLPFSSSRLPNKADDNELILLSVESFLNAK